MAMPKLKFRKGLAPWEAAFDKVVSPFDEFIQKETTAGILLMFVTVCAMAVANSPWAEGYHHLLHETLHLQVLNWSGTITVHHFINDGLMALFFFVVGLEIKREALTGELSDLQQAILPIIAAIGGMVVPALIFFALNAGTPTVDGWGIPMATDIAFAVGILAMLGSRVPKSLLTFLVALAIVDDLGAVVVIALFYTDQIHMLALGLSVLMFVSMVGLNMVGVRSPVPYALFGLAMWAFLMQSGVHATLAGILTAWTIPTRSLFDREHFEERLMGIVNIMKEQDRVRKEDEECDLMKEEAKRHSVLHSLAAGVSMIETPAQRLEHSMHKPVAFLILPLFAFANAGLHIDLSTVGDALVQPVTLGIILGLIAGKFLGITGLSLLAVKMGIGRLPEGCTPQHMIGVGFLGGIGFTMSIFIAELGLAGQGEALLMAKTGILFASLVAGVVGYVWLRRLSPSS